MNINSTLYAIHEASLNKPQCWGTGKGGWLFVWKCYVAHKLTKSAQTA